MRINIFITTILFVAKVQTCYRNGNVHHVSLVLLMATFYLNKFIKVKVNQLSLYPDDGLCEKEVRRRIAMGKAAMGGLTSIWKDRGVTLETKVKPVKVLVFPIVLY